MRGDREFALRHLLPVQQTLEHGGIHGHRTGAETLHRAGHGIPPGIRDFSMRCAPVALENRARPLRPGRMLSRRKGTQARTRRGLSVMEISFQDRVVCALVGKMDVAEFQG